MSYNLLPCFRGTSGYYNSYATPFTKNIVQRSYTGQNIVYLAAVYPVINFELLDRYETRKIFERETIFMQRSGRAGFPAICQARYSRRFDFPEDIRLRAEGPDEGDRTERMQSSRALYEFACGDVDTLELDRRQTSVLEGLERDPSQQPDVLVVEPLWILAFPNEGMTYTCLITLFIYATYPRYC